MTEVPIPATDTPLALGSIGDRPRRVQQIGPDAYFVQRGWLNGNHFVARTPVPTLIDTAHGNDIDVTLDVLRGLGVAPETVAEVLNTHEHPDHTGGNALLHRLSGCRVRLHPVAAARIEGHDEVRTCWRYYDTQLWGEWFPVHGTIAEGEIIAFGGLELEARAAPGHTAGQTVFIAHQEKYLFSADSLWQGDMGVLNTLIDGEDTIAQAHETMAGFLRLGVETVFPGHGPAITNPTPGMMRCLKKLERFLEKPELAHWEHLRKSSTYVVLIRGGLTEAGFFDLLMGSIWFPTLIDRYLGGDYRGVYNQTIADMIRMRMVERRDGRLVATGDR